MSVCCCKIEFVHDADADHANVDHTKSADGAAQPTTEPESAAPPVHSVLTLPSPQTAPPVAPLRLDTVDEETHEQASAAAAGVDTATTAVTNAERTMQRIRRSRSSATRRGRQMGSS